MIIENRLVVVEEPGEEPKLYRQDTGELVGDGSTFIDPFLNAENNEHPNELPTAKNHQQQTPQQRRTRTPTSGDKSQSAQQPVQSQSSSSRTTTPTTTKLYKDIDDLIEKLRLEQQQQTNGKKSETAQSNDNKPSSNANTGYYYLSFSYFLISF